MTDRRWLTPALVYDEDTLVERSCFFSAASANAGGELLFALKTLAFSSVLEIIKPQLNGFACSSLFEATLAREIADGGGRSIHLTTPGLRPDELDDLSDLCDYISFNSLGQWQRARAAVVRRAVSCGLRVNPQLSFVADDRYNPCRRASKLGVPLDQLVAVLRDDPQSMKDIQGLHIHNNCDSVKLHELLATMQRLHEAVPDFLDRLAWINLGGGYHFSPQADLAPFTQAVQIARGTRQRKRTVFFEPGAGIVRRAGRLISSVVDVFKSDGQMIAVLDTTVNHMPEVFEYQFTPEVVGAIEQGPCTYHLVGSTCLAGDLFGVHAFAAPLRVGSQIEFADAGAYALVKAHMFNGINLPTIYTAKSNGDVVLEKRHTYHDFASRNGVERHAFV